MITARTMTRAELDLALGWAAEEGWNPGLSDAAAFFAADPEGFLIAEQDGEPVGHQAFRSFACEYLPITSPCAAPDRPQIRRMTMLVSACQCCGEQIEVSDLAQPTVCGDCQRWLEDDSPQALVEAASAARPIKSAPVQS